MLKKLRDIGYIVCGILFFSWLAYNLVKLFFNIQIEIVRRPLWEYLAFFAMIVAIALLFGWVSEKLEPIYERRQQKANDKRLAKRSAAEVSADMERLRKATEEFTRHQQDRE